MPVPALILAIAVVAVPAPVSPSAPITVKGHQWAPFISPMGEPFRAHSAQDDTLADWFYAADRNHDGVLTVNEMQADAERFFARLDTDNNGEIDPDELAHYEYEIAPDIQVMSRTERIPGQPAPVARKTDADDDHGDDRHRSVQRGRGNDYDSSLGIGGALQGAARYSLLNIPEPVAAADTDFNRGVSLTEFREAAVARFELLDASHQGKLSLAQLEALPHAPNTDGKRRKPDEKAPDARLGNPLPTEPQDR